MKQIILGAALLMAGIPVAKAEGYNRISFSYDWQKYGMNKDMAIFVNADPDAQKEGLNMNGFGIEYTHGFGIAKNAFIETGLGFTAGYGTKNAVKSLESKEYWFQENMKYSNYCFKIPVNIAYRIPVSDELSISPYAGLNLKINIASLVKFRYKTNIPEETITADEDIVFLNTGSYSLFDERECFLLMGNKDYTWNRLQAGWQIGANVNFKSFSFGVEYGMDFVPAFSQTMELYGETCKAKVNTQALKVLFGYTF